MRRFEFQHRAPDGVYLPHVPMSHPIVQLGQLEQAMAAYLFGDLLDDPAGDWQRFWINIGGEG